MQYSLTGVRFGLPVVIVALGLALLLGTWASERAGDATNGSDSDDAPAEPQRLDT